jgi:predicted  nucleic acid-binding Zn-ribbon protein
MEAIESTLKRLADEGQQSVKTDPIATEMQKLVDVLEKKLAEETERYKAGLSPNGHTDVLAADAALSEAKIRLLERQEAVAHSVGGDKVNELRGQVITLQADLAESQGRLKITSQLADEAARSHALDDELQDEKQKIGDLESKIGQVSIEIENLGKELKEVEPTTIVLAQSETVVSKDDKSPASQP